MGNHRGLSVHKEHEVLLKLESAGLNDELAQKIINSKGNRIAKKMISAITGNSELFSGNKYLKLLSGGEELVLDPQDGSVLISEQNDMFAYIDNDFVNYEANEKGEATNDQKVQVYELTKSADFSTFFNSVGVALDRLVLTQAQIINFVKKHRNWLRTDGYANFFLFKSGGKFFVASVQVFDSGALKVSVRRFENAYVWNAEDRHRVVLPQLDSL